MIRKHEYKDLVWIDVESPSKEELDELTESYKLHPLVENELLEPSDRSRVEAYDSHIYMILQFPLISHNGSPTLAQEIDFVLGKDFIITVHYQTIEPLYEFAKMFDVTTTLHQTKLGSHAGYLFYSMIRHLYKGLEDDIDYMSTSLKSAEKRIFNGEEREMVEVLSHISRQLLDCRISITSHREIWVSFARVSTLFFGDKYQYYANAISGEHNRIWNLFDGTKEVLKDLRETNDSLVNTKMNETMIHLTMMAFVIFPLSLIAAIFGMNTQDTPVVGNSYDFWIVIGMMFMLVVAVFGFFKHRKWL
jgi:magnesium transporter